MLLPYRMNQIKLLFGSLTELYDMHVNKRLYPGEWEEITFAEIEKEFEDAREKLIEVLKESRGY
jgi:uncharacterized protein YjaG (DUF416 family)